MFYTIKQTKKLIYFHIFRHILKVLSNHCFSTIDRWVYTFNYSNLTYKTIITYKDKPITYTREELVELLAIIRKHERDLRWKVPKIVIVTLDDINKIRNELNLDKKLISDNTINEFIVYTDCFDPLFIGNLSEEWNDFLSK